VQTARKLLGAIMRSSLPAKVKVEATFHLTCNVASVLVLGMGAVLPLAVLARGRGDLARWAALDLPVFAAATLSVAVFYALALRETYPQDWRRRLWRLPLVMSLGIGMSVNQTRAVVEGLFGRDTSFERTPKDGAVGRARGSRVRTYRQPGGWTPWVELVLAAWQAAAVVAAFDTGLWASLPFLALFGAGFGYVGAASLVTERRARRAATAGDPVVAAAK
jgi:hypothetical protein